MIFEAEVIPVGKGQYGPFKEDGKPDTFYDYLDLAAVDGSGSERATLAAGLVFNPPLFKPVRVKLELHGQQRKLRCHGEALGASAVKAA